ncbi:MAG: helix-turn-helix domain-containing protein [Ignavibacteria bacterium]|nr:helix-turn-helix domain-containing protein [Ignavibacteria bacterium]MBT8393450.1 helix-turn-helix domain-containing protein [Bacteroidia bacterium]NNJ54440.1 helix-turn-helix domain-containing protein [Ignavibacteriaceae bacterium]MBT8382957.1 helix-turn-helix domain-containing protein [Ignavibacteria bacterium]MBT8391085.1 helix-turn-helix domain-containing protein [Ignavibacteria bacterium]
MKAFNYKKVHRDKSYTSVMPEGHSYVLMDVKDLSEYIRYKISYIYSLVHQGKIPYHKPNGKKLFFFKHEIDRWILGAKVRSIDEIQGDYKKQKQNKE